MNPMYFSSYVRDSETKEPRWCHVRRSSQRLALHPSRQDLQEKMTEDWKVPGQLVPGQLSTLCVYGDETFSYVYCSSFSTGCDQGKLAAAAQVLSKRQPC